MSKLARSTAASPCGAGPTRTTIASESGPSPSRPAGSNWSTTRSRPASRPPPTEARGLQRMPTFAELYCRRHQCSPVEFGRRVFWRTLHRHAMPVAPLLLLGNYFESDRSLLEACGRATSLAQVQEE